MRRQRNMKQMKEQGKNQAEQTNEEEIGSLREKQFRVMIVKMIQNLRNRIEKIQEMFNKHLEEFKSKQTVMKNTINEMKNNLEGSNSRKTEAEEWISELEDRIVPIPVAEQNKEKRMKRQFWSNIKCNKIQIIGVPVEEHKRNCLTKYLKRL